MPKIDASKYGYIRSNTGSNFNTARQTGDVVSNQATTSNVKSMQYFQDSGKGATNYSFARFFCAFNTSSYSTGYTITNLTFNFRSTGSTQGGTFGPNVTILKSTAQGNANTDLTTSDFYSDVDYNTAYSSNSVWTNQATDVSISLNATAITAFGTDYLKLVVVQTNNDLGNTSSGSNEGDYGYANFAGGSSGYVPYIQFDAVASGYDNDIAGVSASDIGEVDDVAAADIAKISGA